MENDRYIAMHIQDGNEDGKPLGCCDCGLRYGCDRWMDWCVTPELWAKISPTGDEGGIMCVACASKRFADLNISGVELALTSGSFVHSESPLLKNWVDRAMASESHNAALRAMLGEIQWSGMCENAAWERYSGCPECSRTSDDGHTPDCRIAALVREGGEHTKDTTPSDEEGRDG